MADELEELLDFLSSPSPQVKKAAVDIVRDLTGSDEGLRPLSSRSDRLLPPLSRLLRDPAELSAPAAEALINLSQDHGIAEELVSIGTVSTAMDVMYKVGDRKVVRLMVMLLANLTQLDSGARSLLQVGEKVEGLYVSKLIRSFCRSSSDETSEDTFEHVASILVNISKLEAGRKLLLEPKGGLLKQIIRQFDSTNSLRKKGVCGTIRNCCFEADNQLPNLLLVSEFLWPALLLPVASNKVTCPASTLEIILNQPLSVCFHPRYFNFICELVFVSSVYSQEDTSKMPLELGNALSHDRESVDDPEIRKQALEAIYLISMQEAGRRALWSVNGPRILQVGYEDEEDPKVMEAYELVGSLLVNNAGAGES
ncbi:protein HGH1 homolog isoform X1 [Asparagus officinalis]|uniref:protein HGH1 homolog isoform X1 n=1 Tax=Asparagus officinalis TaxID=4686 RepID=UPI00098E3F88|nr:protein HGH1 homolog isoform X1 [Asparagus officinalis]